MFDEIASFGMAVLIAFLLENLTILGAACCDMRPVSILFSQAIMIRSAKTSTHSQKLQSHHHLATAPFVTGLGVQSDSAHDVLGARRVVRFATSSTPDSCSSTSEPEVPLSACVLKVNLNT